MKLNAIALGATLASGAHAASHLHRHHHRSENQAMHSHLTPRADENATQQIEKRSKTCSFPTNAGLVAITPGSSNGGWAMSPDQQCTADSYCPYACPPGQVMAQWQPGSTYTYPQSMNGGLYCNKNGEVEKPFPNADYCVDGSGAVEAVNKAGSALSFCQTVLPGNEAMLIPTVVDSSATLAVPKSDYWCGTSSHFYINAPGVGSEGCIWGTDSKPVGNWSPYVAGANTDSSGTTFAKIGWNPEWLKSGLKSTKPSYSLSIECDGCNGTPCSINPDDDGINGVNAPSSGVKADTGSYCVVTVPKGKTASIVVASNSGGSGSSSKKVTTSGTPSSTAKATSSSPSSTPSSTVEDSTTSSKVQPTTSSKGAKTTSPASSFNDDDQLDNSNRPGIFFEGNSTSAYSASKTPMSYGSSGADATSTAAAAATTDAQKDEGAGGHQGGAVGSLVIALVVGLYLF